MDGQHELMKKGLLSVFIAAAAFSSCKKCVECEVKLKQSQQVLTNVDEYCGTNKDIEAEEERLNAENICIKCAVNTSFGPTDSGIVCGDLAFTDSVETSWRQAAASIGTSASCIYYRDTVNVACILK